MFIRSLLVSAVLALGAFSCGNVCSGTSCVCTADQTCAFDACTATTSGCNFTCPTGATCTGSCGPNCNVACNGKSCNHAVGAGSSIACGAGTCTITCSGTCTMSGDTSGLTCTGGSTKSVAGCI